MAEAYNRLPSRETLQAATQLEQTKMQRAMQNDQLTLQKASLAVAVLSQIPRDNEENKPAFALSRELLVACLTKALERLQQSDEDDETDAEEMDFDDEKDE